jgi:hypothetical protein
MAQSRRWPVLAAAYVAVFHTAPIPDGASQMGFLTISAAVRQDSEKCGFKSSWPRWARILNAASDWELSYLSHAASP